MAVQSMGVKQSPQKRGQRPSVKQAQRSEGQPRRVTTKKGNGNRAKVAKGEQLFGMSLRGSLADALCKKAAGGKASQEPGPVGTILYIGSEAKKDAHKAHTAELPKWQIDRYERGKSDYLYVSHPSGPIWLVYPSRNGGRAQAHHGLLDKNPYSKARDGIGGASTQIRDFSLSTLVIRFEDATPEERIGGLLGFELAMYEFVRARHQRSHEGFPKKIVIEGATDDERAAAMRLGVAMNISRHLTNLPPSELNPPTYAQAMAELFAGAGPAVKVDVLDEKRLAAERMNLILAVGGGSSTPPRVVHIRYRPKGTASKPVVAVVGKGVTFDTGGVNIKDGAGMRLMKKDMGGSASVVGLAHWMLTTEVDQPCDFYLALAENAVDGGSYRPGDVITARNGKTVEIHNTDAEGRLVMADVFDYALTMKDKDQPKQLIDLATLTGAIKVALGVDLAGLFSNDDGISDKLLAAGQRAGDKCWRMPLVQDYRMALISTVADFTNAGTTSFGGAITAALFLETFAQQKPWAHLDIYAWTDRPQGPFKEPGANGQGVQMLARYFHPSLK